MKKAVLVVLVLIIMLLSFSVMASAQTVTASPTNSKITIDGVEVKFEAYNINGNNYFKLRDIAYSLTDTQKRFSVNWDMETNSANLVLGEEYVSVGGEMSVGNGEAKQAMLSETNILLNGKEIYPTAYMIDYNNYFKLRDLGMALNFGVNWNQETQTVEIETDFKYITDEKVDISVTQFNYVDRANRIAQIQQFLYKNEGMGYAYAKDEGTLEIVLPARRITTEMLHPYLGDVISDDEGYIYVVWGDLNQTDDTSVNTAFISKYSPDGDMIRTTGFTGGAFGDESYNAKQAIVGNCYSVIKGDYLIAHSSRKMYNGHQSNMIIAVNTSDMSPVSTWNNIYTSHSFGQDVIWSEKYKDFFFMNKGDAASRGFVFSSKNTKSVLFDFYLQANANYDMAIVNETFAQLGGLIETDAGFILCGASAKSIGENTPNENQNLFIQVFELDENKMPKFIGGEERTGVSATDIYDNSNTPLTNVTNYGVRWLTDYKEDIVVAPQIVKADDKVVVLWSVRDVHNRFSEGRYYMVLSESGEVLVPQTPLEPYLNSYEKPVYNNGVISWVYSWYNKLGLAQLKVN